MANSSSSVPNVEPTGARGAVVRLIPTPLSEADIPAGKANAGHSLDLAPSTFAVAPPQALEVANASTGRDSFDNRDITDDLDIHAEIVPSRALSF